MGIYQRNLTAAMADNVITPQESEVLAGNLGEIQQLMAQLQQFQQSATTTSTTSNSGIAGDRPTQDNGHTSWTETNLGPILAEILNRLVSIESSATRDTRPTSGTRSGSARTSRREPSVRCDANP